MPSSTSSRLTIPLLIGLALVAAAALTLGLVNGARAGAVSILPVTGQQTGITVCGHGKATTQPDQAQIEAGVQASASRAVDARAQAAQAMTAVLAALKSNGVADQDIQTDYFSIEPQYSYDGSGSHQVGYMVTNNVTATIHGVSQVGKIVDAVTQAGGNDVQINGITFSRGDPSQAETEARQNALTDAHNQAMQIAAGAGMSLGAPISIQVGSCGTSQPSGNFNGAASGQSSSTPFQPGQQEVTVDVGVVYAIH